MLIMIMTSSPDHTREIREITTSDDHLSYGIGCEREQNICDDIHTHYAGCDDDDNDDYVYNDEDKIRKGMFATT